MSAELGESPRSSKDTKQAAAARNRMQSPSGVSMSTQGASFLPMWGSERCLVQDVRVEKAGEAGLEVSHLND